MVIYKKHQAFFSCLLSISFTYVLSLRYQFLKYEIFRYIDFRYDSFIFTERKSSFISIITDSLLLISVAYTFVTILVNFCLLLFSFILLSFIVNLYYLFNGRLPDFLATTFILLIKVRQTSVTILVYFLSVKICI